MLTRCSRLALLLQGRTSPRWLRVDGMATPVVHVFYGSQTGNAEFIAKRIHKECGERGLTSTLTVLNDWKKMAAPAFEEVAVGLFVVSTTGNGDAPENCEKFWRFIKRRTNAKTLMANMSYSVLGLGDTNYDKFCYMGKSLDSRLAELGATRFHKLGCADEAVGLEGTVEPWLVSMWPALLKHLGVGGGEAGAPASAEAGPAEAPPAPEPAAADKEAAVPPPPPATQPAPEPAQPPVAPVERGGPACRVSGVRWMEEVVAGYGEWKAQAMHKAKTAEAGGGFTPELELDVTSGEEADSSSPCSLEGGASAARQTQGGVSSADAAGRVTEGDAVRASIHEARYLAKTSDRRVIELKLSFPSGSLTYVPGDAIGVHCPNPPHLVSSLLDRLRPLGLQPSSRVTIRRGTALGGSLQPGLSVEELLTWHADLSQCPKPRLLRALSCCCSSEEDRQLLLHLSSPEATKVYESFVSAQRLTLPEVLELFPSCLPSLAVLLDLLPPMAPRYYSVASSPLVSADQVTVAFTVVDYTLEVPLGDKAADGACFSVRRRGVCTGWLEDLSMAFLEQQQQPARLGVLLKPAKEFVMPGNAKWPLILIGPGTGVAPFMGFLQHRLAKRKEYRRVRTEVCTGYWRGGFEVCEEGEEEEGSVDAYSAREGQGPVWLFFGCRSREGDWLFRSEMEEYLREGVLSELSTAFSRELPGKKVYVQDRLVEHGARICKWLLSDNAYVYVCGDAANMAKDVHAALHSILMQHGGTARFPNPAAADAFISQLKQRQRYVLDVWA